VSDPIDDAYLLSLAAGRQAGSGPYQYSEDCRLCGHDWHGVTCRKYLPAVGNVNGKCDCPSAWQAAS
jgi:hypothetical protein